jgi:hypothetical protein
MPTPTAHQTDACPRQRQTPPLPARCNTLSPEPRLTCWLKALCISLPWTLPSHATPLNGDSFCRLLDLPNRAPAQGPDKHMFFVFIEKCEKIIRALRTSRNLATLSLMQSSLRLSFRALDLGASVCPGRPHRMPCPACTKTMCTWHTYVGKKIGAESCARTQYTHTHTNTHTHTHTHQHTHQQRERESARARERERERERERVCV